MKIRLQRWARVIEARIRSRVGVVGLLASGVLVVPLVQVWVVGPTPEAVMDSSAYLLFAVSTISVLLATGGPASQIRSGGAMLWLQKPVHPVRFYLDRLVPRLFAAVLTALVLAAPTAVLLAVLGVEEATTQVFSTVPLLVMVALLLVALTHAVSGLGFHPEGFWALLLLIGLFWLRLRLAESDGVLAFGWMEAPADFLALPVDQMEAVAKAALGRPATDVFPSLLHVTANVAFWIGLGTAGVYFRTRSLSGRPGG